MLILSTGSIKGCGNAKVVKASVAMTTVPYLPAWPVLRNFPLIWLRVGLSGVRPWFCRSACFLTLGTLAVGLSFLPLGTATQGREHNTAALGPSRKSLNSALGLLKGPLVSGLHSW